MSRRNQAQAHRRAAGACRERRRAQNLRRAAWVRPMRRLHRTLDSSFRLIKSTLLTAGACQRRAQRRPVRASFELYEASDLLVRAASGLQRVANDLAEVNACIAREPEKAAHVPELLVLATARWVFMTGWLQESSDQIVALQHDILEGVQTGAIIPERIGDSRPRIRLAPRPVPIRAFLLRRQHRVVDRIASLLRRRRRTPRPASLRVPRRAILGRAPPLSVCLL